MSIMPVRKFGDQALKQKSISIKKVDEDIKKMIKNLADTMYASRGLGLAANQIGVMKRVFVMDDSGEGKELKAYANPEIIEKEGIIEEEEGCLSLSEVHVPVKRYKKIKVKVLDIENNEEVEFWVQDMKARVIQHEIDHLDGKLIIDRTIKEERKKAIKEISLYNIPKL